MIASATDKIEKGHAIGVGEFDFSRRISLGVLGCWVQEHNVLDALCLQDFNQQQPVTEWVD